MAHTCPTCSETCYCMGDHSEILSGQPAYCKHCLEYEPSEDETDNENKCCGRCIDGLDRCIYDKD